MTLLPARTDGRAWWTGETSTRRFVLWVCLGVVVLRATYVFQPLRSDEGGYLMIARQWHAGGEFLYGDYNVDRPVLLLSVFRLAALGGWDPMVRVLAIPFALVFVLTAARAAWLLNGPRAARWSALVAGALVVSPATAADQTDGELLAVPLVMAGIVLALTARPLPSGTRRWWLSVGAGALAGAAPLVKQSFLDGLVFIALLLAASYAAGSDRRRLAGLGGGVLAGAGAPHLAVLAWARLTGIDPGRLWTDLAGFRGSAFGVIWGNNPEASLERAATLVGFAVASGLIPILVVWFTPSRLRLRRTCPAAIAISGTMLFGGLAILGGGSFWPHYLLQLAPMAALAAGMVAAGVGAAARRMREMVQFAAATSVVGCLVLAVLYGANVFPHAWFHERTGQWLASSSAPGDTGFVAYGSPSILEAADLSSPYPYLWSLPMRTLDPEQERLRATLAGPLAPTWVVQVNALGSWGLDEDRRLRELMAERYRVVETVCGYDVWLRRDVDRRLAEPPRC